MNKHTRLQRVSGMLIILALAGIVFGALSLSAPNSIVSQLSPFAAKTAEAAELAAVQTENEAEHAIAAAAESGDISFRLGNDLVWFGQDGYFNEQSSDNDILASGANFSLSNSSTKGSIRAAGNEITLSNCKVDQSITVAGNSISLDNCQANAIAVAGNTIYVNCSCTTLYIAGNQVTLGGTINGNVHITANTVSLKEGTTVEGDLCIASSAQADIPSSVSIHGSVEQTIVNNTADIELMQVGISALVGALAPLTFIYAILATLLLALAIEWLARKRTADAALMLQGRPGAMVGTGVIGAIAAPVAVAVLCALVVTLPIAIALSLALVVITITGATFMAASVSKLIFPNMNRYGSTAIAAATIGLCSGIPIVGAIISGLGFMFTIGYMLQRIYLGTLKKQPVDATQNA